MEAIQLTPLVIAALKFALGFGIGLGLFTALNAVFPSRLVYWLSYLVFAVAWIALVVLWLIEAGRPYP